MGAQDKKQVAVVKVKSSVEGPARRRRNAFQRKCLTKAMKRMFADVPSSVRRRLVGFEQGNKARTTA